MEIIDFGEMHMLITENVYLKFPNHRGIIISFLILL